MSALPPPYPAWPVGGGVLGALIRTHDWAATPLGPLQGWPAALRTLVDLVIHSPLPMAVLWGPDLIQVYNDGYAAICGPRHPQALGQPHRPTWPELQDFIGAVYQDVLHGETRVFNRMRLVVERSGAPEEIWVDLSYSPAWAEGEVRGIVKTAVDVTADVHATNALLLNDERFHTYAGSSVVYRMNADWSEMHQLPGRGAPAGAATGTMAASGTWLGDIIDPDDQPAVARAIAQAIRTRDVFEHEHRVRLADGTPGWMLSRAVPLLAPDGTIREWFGTAVDISARKQRELRQAALLGLGDRLRMVNNADEAAAIASEVVGTTLGVTQAGFGRINPVAASTRVVRDWRAGPGVPSVVGVHAFRHYGSYYADLQRGAVVAIADVGTDPRTAAQWDVFQTLAVRALLNVPVLDASGAVGVFLAHQDRPRAWTADEIAFVRGVADRTWAEMARIDAAKALRALNQQLEQLAEESAAERDRMWRLSGDIMLVTRAEGPIAAVNPAWRTILGWEEQELVGANLFDLVHPDDMAPTQAALSMLDNDGRLAPNFQNRYRHRDGSYRWIAWNASRSDDMVVAVGRDVTLEREHAAALFDTEEKLRQSLKMEAVGQLTGGLAHDFNNLLASIGGSLELLTLRVRTNNLQDLDRFVGIAQGAVRRAAALTHRLLAFSRRQPLDARPLDPAGLVDGMLDLVRRTIGPAIALEIAHAPGVWPTLVDPNQLENALLNLCINARDAMPDGGRLRIALSNAVLDAGQAARSELAAGDYVLLSVSDTGTGMAPEVLAKAFDPFYTTKPIGQGTGLGLSMIYGFARQSGGHVSAESAPGRGTAMHMLLPRHLGAAPAAPAAAAAAEECPATAAVRVLLVDDEAPLRGLMAEALSQQGHRVVQAGDAATALRLLGTGAPVDLMVTDIGLAGGMNGRQLAEAARLARPGLKVLFITGYAEARLVERGSFDPGTGLMVKPFQLDTLARRVAQMAAQPSVQAAAFGAQAAAQVAARVTDI
jgi:PAS domain S-box-containing protein